ncbi:DUF4189 domain-containing protein [Xanthomonas phaseoli]|uniref:DUF4189 domain-containing protein n=1 Tax=Xanthomonas manihotis TaxID=43353 RepID=A0A8I2BW31_XANMN|nr:DUF4189 domain-containing protein [Xanthomonas phaseoli]MBO9720080.1 DUF4189 domain-containing protein [Xanthomonas phaseoli pv. manihotis]MBO9757922.1 DUF4189 domain-containing protein [Xanthomonas phaseoli pv. manihotis]MBO9760783.1 DUF4189 domain-containing protein [Xanthomonas phaseoli pv. manihotis]MBO9765672.1 DUF4189 domain-containing protein [Xanthomonas phaseoli pv. manihotis]MBO9785417.1 DUF4189 domain-containing protein [Xanthomonas phaseoli pv. manihotis]
MFKFNAINKFSAFFIFLGISYFSNIHAQTACPVGVAPGSPQCGPDSGTSRGDNAPPRPTGKWTKTWGALAANSAGDIGLSSGKISKEDAAAESVLRCEEYDAGKCVAKYFFYNQCISIARASSGKSATVTGPKDKAPSLAIEECEQNSGSSCSILVTECSNPVFERF